MAVQAAQNHPQADQAAIHQTTTNRTETNNTECSKSTILSISGIAALIFGGIAYMAGLLDPLIETLTPLACHIWKLIVANPIPALLVTVAAVGALFAMLYCCNCCTKNELARNNELEQTDELEQTEETTETQNESSIENQSTTEAAQTNQNH